MKLDNNDLDVIGETPAITEDFDIEDIKDIEVDDRR